MVNTYKIASVARDVLLAPVYLYQGRKIKRDTVRLPEPNGERHGQVQLSNVLESPKDARKQTLNLMIVGDSAAAGVGSETQQEALVGNLIPVLTQQFAIQNCKRQRGIPALISCVGFMSYPRLASLLI